jgi:hypothetical protein
MKMRKINVVNQIFTGLLSAAICVLTLLAAVPCYAAQSDLKKSEDYIYRSLEEYGSYQTSGPNGEFFSERLHIIFDGCNASIHVLSVGADEPPYRRESINLDVVFNLKALDPIIAVSPHDLNDNKLPDNREWIILRTADRSESIIIWCGNIPASAISAYPLPGSASHADNLKLAEAFSRAITICSQMK